jgi:hypothetical protein
MQLRSRCLHLATWFGVKILVADVLVRNSGLVINMLHCKLDVDRAMLLERFSEALFVDLV